MKSPIPKTIEVQLFAGAKTLAGRSFVAIQVPSNPTAADVVEQLSETCEAIIPLLPACRLAVDCEYVGDDFVVPDGAELALIPPVSGG